jgi:peptide/nickel transport system substrate-binding protein
MDKSKVLLIVSVVLITVLAVGCQKPVPIRNDINIGWDQDIHITNPIEADAYTRTYIVPLIYSSLFATDGFTYLKKDLADSFSLVDNILTVQIRKDAKFHDTKPLLSGDIKYSFNHAIVGGSYKQLDIINNINIIDEHTIEFILNKNFGPIFFFLNIPIVPEGSLDAEGNVPWGSGPFRVEESAGGALTLVKNQDYYGEQPKLDKVRIIPFKDGWNRFVQLEVGKVDLAWDLLEETYLKALDDGNINWFQKTRENSLIVKFNLFNNFLKNPSVRSVIKSYFDIMKDDTIEVIGKNNKVLRDIGYTHGFELTLIIPKDNEYLNIANKAKDQLKSLDIDIRIIQRDYDRYLEDIQKGRTDIYLKVLSNQGMIPFLHNDVNELYSNAIKGERDREFKLLLARLDNSVEPDSVLMVISEILDFIKKDNPFIVLSSGQILNAYHPLLQGIKEGSNLKDLIINLYW